MTESNHLSILKRDIQILHRDLINEYLFIRATINAKIITIFSLKMSDASDLMNDSFDSTFDNFDSLSIDCLSKSSIDKIVLGWYEYAIHVT